MKHLITILIILFSLQFLQAGEDPYIVTFSPDNPVVGEMVTFTLSNGNLSCVYHVDPDANDEGVGFSSFPGASHIYTAAGIYTVDLDEECSTDLRLVPGGFWQLRNSSGTVSSNKTITVTAPVTSNSIPTMGEWGIIALALSLVIFSIVGIKEIARNKKNAVIL